MLRGRLCARFCEKLAVMAEGATGPGAAALRAVENCEEEIERIWDLLLSTPRRGAAPGPDDTEDEEVDSLRNLCYICGANI